MPTTLELRRGVARLATLASVDLAALWRDAETLQAALEPLNDALPALIEAYGAAAATYAADWYDELRDERELRGRFTAITADLADAGTAALLGWAATEATELPAFQTLVQGGTQRRIANYARLTISGSSVADPQARGWQRVGDGSSCDFCSMLLGRGAVYTEATADFQAHDHCGCSAEPAWR